MRTLAEEYLWLLACVPESAIKKHKLLYELNSVRVKTNIFAARVKLIFH